MRTRTALLVDDEDLVREYISTILRREGFEVVEACDGIDALSVVHRMHEALDVLITDIEMPRMTGVELAKAVKTEHPGIPIVYISGSGRREGLPNGRGQTAFVEKPFGPEMIVSAVRRVMAPQFPAGPGLEIA